MGLRIQRVTHNKHKLLFASLAIMALAVQPLYGFVASKVANAADGNILYVNQNTGKDSFACTSPEKPCRTISKAISKSETQKTHEKIDTIKVYAGSYSEDISINKTVTIEGLGGVVVSGQVKVNPGASDVTLSGFGLSNNGSPAVKVPSNVSLDSLTLRDMNIDSFKAVYIGDGSGTLGSLGIYNSTITSNYPVYVDHPTASVVMTNNTFNTVNGDRGVVLAKQSSSDVDMQDNTFNTDGVIDVSQMVFVKYENSNKALLETVMQDNYFVQNNKSVEVTLSGDDKSIVFDGETPPRISVENRDSKKYFTKNDAIKLHVVDMSGIREIHANIRAIDSNGQYVNSDVYKRGLGYDSSNIKTKMVHDVTLNDIPEGQYELKFSALDTLKNSSKHQTFKFFIDNAKPWAELKSTSIGNISEKVLTKADIALRDNMKIVAYTINDVRVPVSSGTTKWGDANGIKVNSMNGVFGENTLTVEDAAGNVSEPFNFYLDKVAPKAEVKSSSTKNVNGVNYASDRKSIQITGTAEDRSNIKQHWFELKAPDGKFYYAKDFSGTSKTASFYLHDIVPTDSKNRAQNGTYVIRYVATDEFDNRSDCFRQPLCQGGSVTTYTLVIDNDLPDVSASMSSQDITLGDSNPTVTIKATDAGSNIDSSSVMYKVFKKGGDESKDVVIGWTGGLDESENNYTGTVDVNKLVAGEYTLRARAADNAGNKKSRADVAFTIKTADPEEPEGPTTPTDPVDPTGPVNPNPTTPTETPSDMETEEELDGVPTVSDPTLNRAQSVNSIFNRNFALNLNASGDDSASSQNEAETQTDTLGDSTANATTGEDVKGAADEKSQTGFAWYWWLLIVAAVAAIWWWIAAARKRGQDA